MGLNAGGSSMYKLTTKTLLGMICYTYLTLRNLAWIAFILIACWLMLGKAYASLWPTPCPVPTEIHVPTGEDLIREYEEDKENAGGDCRPKGMCNK